jgi:membrane protease YdiL (CAAX protease family)
VTIPLLSPPGAAGGRRLARSAGSVGGVGAVHSDGRPGSEGSGSGHPEAAAGLAGQDQAGGTGAAPAAPDAGDPATSPNGASEQPHVRSGAAPPSEPAGWDPSTAGGVPPGPPFATAQFGQGPASPVGVAAPPPVPPAGWAHFPPPPGYPAGPPPVPGQPYPPGPYPPTGPYPAPSIGRQPPSRSSWAAPSPTRTHRWGLGAYLLAEGVFLLVSGLISVFAIGGAPATVGTLVIALAVPTVLAACTALLITRVRGNGPRTDLGLVWSWRDVGVGLGFGLGGLALTIPASIVYVAIVGQDATSAVGDVFGGIRAGPAMAVLVLVIVVFVAPTCEEILYRGLLWGGIEKIAGRWVAFAVSTLLFAIAHFEFTRTPLLLVVAVPIAIARLYTGRLLASIVAHQVNNLLPGIALALGLLGVIPMT